MIGRSLGILLALVLACLAASSEPCSAQTPQLVPFGQFYASLPGAQSAAYVGPTRAASVPAFNEMRQHLLSLYSGVAVQHSFLFGDMTFDCVPVAQQPSVRLANLTSVASPPSLPDVAPASGDSSPAVQASSPQQTDSLGNAVGCEQGSIPMQRITVDAIARFGTLKNFFAKGPGDAGQFPMAASTQPTHKYAHSYQSVKSLGGTVDINLWDPFVDTSKGEIFSLAQYWYVNTTSVIQTLEGGIQNYPQKYNTTKSVLFLYWTADDYEATGCYNLDCRGFVQTNPNVMLGGPFGQYSTLGGTQYQITLRAFLYQGNWWIYLNGGAAANAIGYYPASIYLGGPLSVQTNEIDYGGETVGSTIWPQMGSGDFPAKGYKYAAYMKEIAYYPTTTSAVAARLQGTQPSPRCYKDTTFNDTRKTGFGTYFYFGGPGGARC